MSDEHLDIIDTPDGLLADVRSMIEQTRARVARETYSMLYERTAISRKPEEVARAELAQLREDDRLAPTLVFKDPYVLDFLGLNDRYLDRDLEDAILREIETFLLELGDGFAFLGRQKRIQIDSDDFLSRPSVLPPTPAPAHRPLISSSATSRPNTKVRWNSISAGLPSTSSRSAKNRRLASFFALAKKRSRLNCSNSDSPVSTLPNI